MCSVCSCTVSPAALTQGEEARLSDSAPSKAEVLSLCPAGSSMPLTLGPCISKSPVIPEVMELSPTLRHIVQTTLLQLAACPCSGIPLENCGKGRKR